MPLSKKDIELLDALRASDMSYQQLADELSRSSRRRRAISAHSVRNLFRKLEWPAPREPGRPVRVKGGRKLLCPEESYALLAELLLLTNYSVRRLHCFINEGWGKEIISLSGLSSHLQPFLRHAQYEWPAPEAPPAGILDMYVLRVHGVCWRLPHSERYGVCLGAFEPVTRFMHVTTLEVQCNDIAASLLSMVRNTTFPGDREQQTNMLEEFSVEAIRVFGVPVELVHLSPALSHDTSSQVFKLQASVPQVRKVVDRFASAHNNSDEVKARILEAREWVASELKEAREFIRWAQRPPYRVDPLSDREEQLCALARDFKGTRYRPPVPTWRASRLGEKD